MESNNFRITLKDIGKLFNYQLSEEDFTGLCLDSRKVQFGKVFVAIKGEQVDGNSFINNAINKGAGAVITEQDSDVANSIVVTNNLDAMYKIANLVRDKYTGHAIAITGSCGKTSTRHIVANILRYSKYQVLESYKNYNNHYGVPLMVSNLTSKVDFAVLECGASGIKEIDSLVQLIKPHVAAITNINPVHIEGFGSLENIAKTKGEIFNYLTPGDTAVIPYDSKFKKLWLSNLATNKVITFGLNNSADVYADNIQYSAKSTRATVHVLGNSFEIFYPLPGKAMLLNLLTALAVLVPYKLPVAVLIDSITKLTTFSARFEFIVSNKFAAEFLIDCYNANPAALLAAVDLLLLQTNQPVVVLGDMLELGENAADIHFDLGKQLKAKGVLHLWAIGDLAKYTVEGFADNGYWFANKAELAQALNSFLQTGINYTVLFKGSRSIGLEEVVRELC